MRHDTAGSLMLDPVGRCRGRRHTCTKAIQPSDHTGEYRRPRFVPARYPLDRRPQPRPALKQGTSMRAIRAVSLLAVLLLLAANAFALAPQGEAYSAYLPWAGLALSFLVLILLLALRVPAGTRVTTQAALPARVQAPANRAEAEAEIVSFLALLQDKGRLVDFLMDDINVYDDAQVGAASRVVHAGCKAALLEHFQIRPVRAEDEGTKVRIEAGYPADEYR